MDYLFDKYIRKWKLKNLHALLILGLLFISWVINENIIWPKFYHETAFILIWIMGAVSMFVVVKVHQKVYKGEKNGN